MAGKSRIKGAATNPGGAQKIKQESTAEQAEMREKNRRPEKKGGKLLKGSRRRVG